MALSLHLLASIAYLVLQIDSVLRFGRQFGWDDSSISVCARLLGELVLQVLIFGGWALFFARPHTRAALPGR